uniref:Transposase n=1 Tax=Haemonchus contortus TaxID=6289 RepID=A0A7I4YHL7_HAECO
MKLMDGKYLENKRIKPVMHLRLNWRWLSCRIWERLEFDENDYVVTPSSTKRSVNRS